MIALVVLTAGAYGYTLTQVAPGSRYGSADTLGVTVAFGVMGVGYAIWAAVLNRSLIVALLGPAEVFLAATLGFFLVRRTRAEYHGLAVFIAVVGAAAFLYPWFKAEHVLRRLRGWTGLL